MGNSEVIMAMTLILVGLVSYFKKIRGLQPALFYMLTVMTVLVFTWYMSIDMNTFRKDGVQTGCLFKSGYNAKINGLFHGGCVDVWHILHLLLYLNAGIIYPGKYLLFFIVSVSWEFFEHFVFNGRACSDPYCGRIEDILINMAGYWIGSTLVTKKF